MPPPDESDGIAALAGALLGYVAELKAYRALCMRHGRAAVIEETDGCLQVTRLFASSEQGIACVHSCLGRLPGWKQTPLWSTQKTDWERLERKQNSAIEARRDLRQSILRGVNWHARAVLVHSFVTTPDEVLHLDVLLPPVPGDLPELPLRRIADALRCHELLLPPTVLAAIPVADFRSGRAMSLGMYLQRATPKNLLASQCFWLPGAEQCPSSPGR